MAGAYRRASKKEKGRILEQVVEATDRIRRERRRLHREIGRLQEKLVALQTRKRRGVEGAGPLGNSSEGVSHTPPAAKDLILRKGFRHFFREDMMQLSGTFLVDATGPLPRL